MITSVNTEKVFEKEKKLSLLTQKAKKKKKKKGNFLNLINGICEKSRTSFIILIVK
jgi:hypothetical protein